MKRLAISFFVLCLAMTSQGKDVSRPFTFWYWMYGAVSKEGIHADLQAMKDVGLGGCYLMPIRGAAERPEYEGKADALSPEFWHMADYALQQADSLGLEMGVHICDGFALAGGPWITPAESMQKMVWADTLITVTKKQKTVVLPSVSGNNDYYEDIAAWAVSAYEPLPEPLVGGTIVRNENGVFRATAEGDIVYHYSQPVTVRSVKIIPSGNNLQAQRLLVQAGNDGISYRDIRQLVPPRQGWQNTDEDYTYVLPATTARFFRFHWTPEGTEPGAEDLDAGKWSPVLKVKDILLSADPCIDQYESKNGSIWRKAVSTDIASDNPTVIALDNNTVLPPGRWRILRMGHTTTGHTNATAGGAKGLECDKFSKEAVEKQVDSWFGLFMNRPNHKAIRYLHVDSWECGSQNWSKNFAEEFKLRRGYDLLPYLPVYAGVPMQNGEQVLRDIRMTINDLINDVFFATVAKKAREYGVQLSSESVAPTMVSDGMEHYKYVDIPMGEFWLNSPTHDKPNDMLDAISGAHVYGKNIVQAEGFTELRGVWDETPAMVKPLLDRNFCLGMNKLFFHVNTHNPWLDRKPGMTLDGIGLFFQRDNTWFSEAKGFVDYITRCQELLQKGQPVVDIAVYTGDELPSRALTPDRLVPMLPGLFGKERVESEQKRLANEGQPMTESPVGVRHSAGIIDLKDWVNALHGYQYDSMNRDALMLATVEDGCMVMPGGMRYRVLVIPDQCLVSKESRQRIEELRNKGITVIDSPYHEATLPGISPDAILPEGIDFAHRKGDGHYYFICNQTDSVRTFRAKLRMEGNPIMIDPVSGNLLNCREEQQGDYRCVDITLPEYGSVFVVSGMGFTDVWPKSQTRDEVRPIGKNLKWDITFLETDQHITTRQLFDWSQSNDERIRYYSGHVRYSTNFTMKEGDLRYKTWWLRLPGLKDIAHVWLNGQDLGTVWTAPYEVELGKILRKGTNTLEIEVVNTWHNALSGADQGKAPYEGIWTNAKYRTKGDGLLPAGLLQVPQLCSERHHLFRALMEE